MSDPYLSVSGAIARLHELDVVANNLANSDTVGFKRDRSAFGVFLETRIDDIAGAPTEGAPGRVFTGTETTGVDFSTGPVHQTGAPLDVAILGPSGSDSNRAVTLASAGSRRPLRRDPSAVAASSLVRMPSAIAGPISGSPA